jgi:hypothetical protein
MKPSTVGPALRLEPPASLVLSRERPVRVLNAARWVAKRCDMKPCR